MFYPLSLSVLLIKISHLSHDSGVLHTRSVCVCSLTCCRFVSRTSRCHRVSECYTCFNFSACRFYSVPTSLIKRVNRVKLSVVITLRTGDEAAYVRIIALPEVYIKSSCSSLINIPRHKRRKASGGRNNFKTFRFPLPLSPSRTPNWRFLQNVKCDKEKLIMFAILSGRIYILNHAKEFGGAFVIKTEKRILFVELCKIPILRKNEKLKMFEEISNVSEI